MEFEACYRAVQGRDTRFDGWFYTAVTSTGVYCRPSCPARTPHRPNVRFYPSAAAAQRAGFRACLRCRPDAAPGSPEWNTRSDVVARAVRLIGDGVVDREGVTGLAARLGYGVRHLHRLVAQELGAGPLALARAQRVQAARLLIETTDLAMADVAFAAGFASVRQFNETVHAVLGRTPTELRRRRPAADRVGEPGTLALRLPYRAPMAAGELLAFVGRRALPGVETWDGTTYARTLRLPRSWGWVALRAADGHVAARLALGDLRDLSAAVGRCRRALDLDADPVAVDAVLSSDSSLAPVFVPGRRVPGGEGLETLVRAVAGQRVSVACARATVARLVEELGEPLGAEGAPSGLVRLFPDADALAGAGDGALPLPAARRSTVRTAAALMAAGELALDPGADPAEALARLMAVPGVGPWTAGYVAMRALGDPDAFLATDLGVRRGLEALGLAGDPGAALDRAQAWRPWRSYAMAHLWAAAEGAAARRSGRPHTRKIHQEASA